MKAKNPLMSVEARGNYEKVFEFLGGRSGTAIRQYRKRGKGLTARQYSKREDLLIVSRAWADLTDGERASWESYGRLYPKVSSLGDVYYIPGYNAFVGLASKAREQGAVPVSVAPTTRPPDPVLDPATESGLEGQIIVTWNPASDGDNVEMWLAGPLRPGRKAKSTDYRLNSFTPMAEGVKVLDLLELEGLYNIKLKAVRLNGQTSVDLKMAEVAGAESLKGYYACSTDPGRIAVVDFISFLHEQSYQLPAGNPWIAPLAADSRGRFLYTVDYSSPGECIKLDRSPLSKITDIYLTGVTDFGFGSVVDHSNEYLYVCGYPSPGKVFKIRLYDFSVESTGLLGAGVGGNRGMVIDGNDEFIYMSCNLAPRGVVKIRASDLVQVGFCSLAPISNGVFDLAIDETRGYIYVGVQGPPHSIARIELSAFVYQDKLDTGDPKGQTNSLVMDEVGGLLYAGTSGFPAWVLKVDLSSFSIAGELQFNSGEDRCTTGLIDLRRGYSYWTTNTSPSLVVKVRSSDLVRVGSISLPTADADISGAVSVGS